MTLHKKRIPSPLSLAVSLAIATPFGLSPISAVAQESIQTSTPTQAEDSIRSLDTLVVTGSRGLPRSIEDSATPIDVFSSEDLAQGSPTGIFESLRYLVPSFNLPTRAGGGTATVIAQGGLRGLNPDQTLVLVNGKRRHRTSLISSVSTLYNGAAGVDLNMIPSAAIDRIEVLRDGAAAQYGSDAIAGVINIILKQRPEGGEVSLSTGENFDRGDGEFVNLSGNVGLPFGDAGFASLSYNFTDRKASNRAVPIADSVNLYPLLPDGSRDPREGTIDRMVTQNYGGFPQTSNIFGANVAYQLGSVELYGYATYADRESILDWSFRTPTNIASLPELYPNGFSPRLTLEEEDYEFVGGARGDLGEWQWDLSTGYGYNGSDWYNSNGLNASLGPASPTFFYVGALQTDEWVTALDLTRGFELANGSHLQVSYGLQHRLESFSVRQGEEASWIAGDYVRPPGQVGAGQVQTPGSQATPGFRPDDESDLDRNNVSAYTELGWDATDRLFLSAALRYEHFDDSAGTSLIYKVNGRYEINDWLAVRGSYNTGFRAPSLAQQGYSSTTSQFRDVDGDGVTELLLLKNLPVNSAEAIALGATPLVPEESRNISFGVTANPLPNLSLTLDLYQVDVDDRIAVTTTFSPLDTRLSPDGVTTVGQQIQSILVANGLAPEISGQYYTNAIDTRTRGLDFVASYQLPTRSAGDFGFTIGFNRNYTRITSIIDNPPELAALGDIVVFDRGKQGALTDAIPDSKLSLGVDWTYDRFSANLRGTRFGEYVNRNATNPASDVYVDADWVADLELSYAVTDRLTMFAGANNILNTYPQEVQEPSATTGSNMYNTLAPFGFTGGSWYLRATYAW